MLRHRRAPLLLALPARRRRPARRARRVQGRPEADQGRAGRGRRPAEAPAVDGPRPGPLLHHLGLHHPAPHDHRGLRRPLRQVLPHPAHRDLGLASASSRTSSPSPSSSPSSSSPSSGSRTPRAGWSGKSRFFGSHTGAAWLVLAHDRRRHDHPAPLPGRPGQHRHIPLRLGGLRLPRRGQAARTRSAPGSTACWRRSSCSLNIAIISGFIVFVSYSKHLHIFLAPINVAFSRRPRALGALYSTPGHGHGERRRGHRVRRRARSSTSPGSSCSTSPPAPSAGAASRPARPGTPASRSRPSCSSWTCATTCSPRPTPVMLEPGDGSRQTGPGAQRHRPRRAVVLHHLRRLRRASARSTSSTSTPSSTCAATRCSWSPSSRPRPASCCATSRTRATPGASGQAKRTEWTAEPRLRGPGHHRAPSPTTSSTSTGSAAPAPSTSGPARARRPRPACCTGPASPSASSAPRSPAPATRSAAWATSTSTRSRRKMNIATLDEAGAKKIIATCPHCFNTIKNEYPALGGNFEVIHHAELLEHLVAVGQAHARVGLHGQGHLPRPLLPGPAQPGLRRAPLGARAPSPASSRSRCSAAGSGASAAAPAAPACGWRRTSASGSTWSAPTRRSAPAPTSSRRPAPTA